MLGWFVGLVEGLGGCVAVSAGVERPCQRRPVFPIRRVGALGKSLSHVAEHVWAAVRGGLGVCVAAVLFILAERTRVPGFGESEVPVLRSVQERCAIGKVLLIECTVGPRLVVFFFFFFFFVFFFCFVFFFFFFFFFLTMTTQTLMNLKMLG